MDRLLIISADGHCGAKPETYRPYLERKYWDALDDLVLEDRTWSSLPLWDEPDDELLAVMDPRGAISGGRRIGAWDLDVRLKELDAEGIAGETLGQGHQLASPLWFGEENINAHSAELRAVGSRAHHRWLAEAMEGSGGRFLGFADPGPCVDMDATVKELTWVAEHGFVTVGLPGILADPNLPPLFDPYYQPFWDACDDLGLRLFIHAGYGGVQGTFLDGFSVDKKFADAERAEHDKQLRIKFVVQQRRVFWQLILGGMFDHHPDLPLVFTELRADWVPGMLEYLDNRFEDEKVRTNLTPSEYFHRQCFVTPSSIRRHEVALRHQIGVGHMMFGADYPHPESTWPNTKDWIKLTFNGVPEDEARKILGENAMDLFGFDPDTMKEVAERIGPTVDETLVDPPNIDPREIDHFHARSGFDGPIEDPLQGWGLEEMLQSDFASTAANRA